MTVPDDPESPFFTVPWATNPLSKLINSICHQDDPHSQGATSAERKLRGDW